MCLEANVSVTKKFLKDNENKEFIYGYKVLYTSLSDKNTTAFRGYQFHKGVNKADKPRKLINRSCGIRGGGIHVYLNKYSADVFVGCGYYYKIIKVKCYLKDLVGVGTFSDEPSAVFREVHWWA